MNKPRDLNVPADVPSDPADSTDPGLTATITKPADPLGTTGRHRPAHTEDFGTKPDSDAPADDLPAMPGYRVLREIARGGMGRVLAAFDIALERHVAIKTLLPGANADRFVRESKITARLPHPGIPPVHALGTLADGSPFLAMKLIAGQTLADELKTAERPRLLQAFTQVCQAVGFAHSRGVIHRDLKPSNIMVGAFGEVQVMDWGLAKDLTSRDDADVPQGSDGQTFHSVGTDADRTTDHASSDESADDQTKAGQVFGTPAYMAPEQARGETTDARADVFAPGRHPVRSADWTAAVCRQVHGGRDPPGPSCGSDRGAARLDGCGADAELVALGRRCLSPSPVDRPANGQAVADELTAYLNGVQERLKAAEREQAVTVVRVNEELRRRRLQVIAASLVLLALAAGIVGTAFGLIRAESRRLEAEQSMTQEAEQRMQAEKARGEANSNADHARQAQKLASEQAQLALGTIYDVVTIAEEKLRITPGTGPLRKELLQLVMKRLDQISKDAVSTGKADRTMGVALQRMGDFYNQMGMSAQEIEVHERSLEIFDRLIREYPSEDWNRFDAAVSHESLGEIAREVEPDPARLFDHYEKSLELRKALVTNVHQPEPSLDVRKRSLATIYVKLAMLALAIGVPARAGEYARKAVRHSESIAAESPDRIKLQAEIADDAYFAMARASLCLFDEAHARGYYRRCAELRQERVRANAANPNNRQELARVWIALGDLEIELGHGPAALENYRKAHDTFEVLAKEDSANRELQWYLANTDYALGTVNRLLRDKTAADQFYQACLKTREALLKDDPNNPQRKIELMLARARLGRNKEASAAAADVQAYGSLHPGMLFAVACCYALCKQAETERAQQRAYADKSATALRQAVEHGYRDLWAIETKPELEPMRDQPIYQEVLKQLARK